jgi:hypothetical protein
LTSISFERVEFSGEYTLVALVACEMHALAKFPKFSQWFKFAIAGVFLRCGVRKEG